MQFIADFSGFKIDLKPDKFLSNVSNPLLLLRKHQTLRSEVKHEDKKNIENLFDFNQRLGSCVFTFERVL